MNNQYDPQMERQAKPLSSFTSSGFNEHWDLGTDHHPQLEPGLSRYSQAVLDGLKEARRYETADWINALTHELQHLHCSPFSTSSSTSIDEQNTLEWLERIFDELEFATVKFNESGAVQGFFVNCTRPATSAELESSHTTVNDLLSKTGYLSTRTLSLLLRANENKISIFVLPAETLLGFLSSTLEEEDFPPVAELKRTQEQKSQSWHVGDRTIVYDQLAVFAAQLFSGFVRIAGIDANVRELRSNRLQ